SVAGRLARTRRCEVRFRAQIGRHSFRSLVTQPLATGSASYRQAVTPAPCPGADGSKPIVIAGGGLSRADLRPGAARPRVRDEGYAGRRARGPSDLGRKGLRAVVGPRPQMTTPSRLRARCHKFGQTTGLFRRTVADWLPYRNETHRVHNAINSGRWQHAAEVRLQRVGKCAARAERDGSRHDNRLNFHQASPQKPLGPRETVLRIAGV